MAHLLLLLFGCVCLFAGGHALITGAMSIGKRLDLSPALVGMVLVALGTSAPELAVSLDAALTDHGDIAVGNVVGSNIANLALVLGIAVIVRRLPAGKRAIWRDYPMLMLLSLVSMLMLADRLLSRAEAVVLLLLLVAYLLFTFRASKEDERVSEFEAEDTGGINGLLHRWSKSWTGCLVVFFVGAVLLVIGAEAMVKSGVAMAAWIGVSEAVIALTVTAVGTGIPEIAATAVAVARRESSVAMGNVIGSNMMNLALILGVSASVVPLHAPGLEALPIYILLGLTVVVWLHVVFWRGIERWMGAGLLVGYVAYTWLLFY